MRKGDCARTDLRPFYFKPSPGKDRRGGGGSRRRKPYHREWGEPGRCIPHLRGQEHELLPKGAVAGGDFQAVNLGGQLTVAVDL